MAFVRIPINPLQVGRVGAYSMYVSQGRQIVRQRQNSSNYGEGAARSLAQQTRRARWGNLVNTYKALKFWQPKAWEGLRAGVTDYNAFMGANINRTPIYLTKDMVQNGCAVMDNFTLSKGSLVPIDGSWEAADQAFTTNVRTSAAVTPTTTIAQLSQDIASLNGGFEDGDNIAYIVFQQQVDERGYPYLRSLYHELTLDSKNTALASTLEIFPLILDTNPENLFFKLPETFGWTTIGAVAIHTRRSSTLKVSTQQMTVISTEFIDRYITEEARTAAIESYGLDTEVPLEPSFDGAAAVTITADGSEFNNLQIFPSAVDLVISGQNLSPASIQLYKDEILYTPLQTSEGSWKYILGDNGRYRVFVNGVVQRVFYIEGIVMPENLTLFRGMIQLGNATAPWGDGIHGVLTESACINYPRLASDERPYFALQAGFGVEPNDADFGFHNCSLVSKFWYEEEPHVRLNLSIVDRSSAAYVTYQGFIIAVFNYQN